ncbi:hypothetical protein AB4212_04600 [Streptomyces sp. 2MCAF27]
MSAMTGLRLLPWSDPDGKPCYLASDDGNSRLSRRADEIEALQVAMGRELLRHARVLLEDGKADVREVRFLADRLCESLGDVLRVAESRGGRLPSNGEGDGEDEPEDFPDEGPAPGSAGGRRG